VFETVVPKGGRLLPDCRYSLATNSGSSVKAAALPTGLWIVFLSAIGDRTFRHQDFMPTAQIHPFLRSSMI
jgi:hypothetical protein